MNSIFFVVFDIDKEVFIPWCD